ncbi:MAG: hypothetical protein HZA91_04360 [Verrucomicrobia bacterium]|nr:hypothetical protein [Verrucomicrobiota bacterium]
MKLAKSSRHSKITGDFGESIVLYLLSRHGFECARVDHTGIDLIARRPDSREVLGISVKSRSRQAGTENAHLALPHGGFVKAKSACKAFGCTPYFALVIDAGQRIRIFLLSLRRLQKLFPGGRKVSAWQMSEPFLRKYYADPQIAIFELATHGEKWF